ncbi:uncharacterized protein F5891DRAFT_1021394 [Suillus fuscotomentosus]|uniref:Uncharacterized protein n=1 Tax=Suillus fuscotomentosus TaxID=1912939 RepID=A0AAD4ED71_9AGAM|nr:uncharacterized protein F5891DRAFT_1021394 [Suillus fuscotomentosus]KAG1902839.1 hypothetical protein F5891DRAFT_1021394 [Suillus fuscotomentosus]
MKQWARMYDTPLMTHQFVTAHAGPHGQAFTGGINFALADSFPKDSGSESKHDKMVPSSVSPPPSPNEAVPRLSRGAILADRGAVQLEQRDLPSWTPMVVSDSEGGMDELPLGVEQSKASPSNARETLSQKCKKNPNHGPPIAMPRQEAQQAPSGVYSGLGDSRGFQSLQEMLQATFSVNGSYNISPPAAPIESEGSSTDVQAVIYNKQRRQIHNTRRSTSQEGSEPIAVVDAPIPNATTAVPTITRRKAAPAIPYESMQKVIDAALDTRVAKITWRRWRNATECDTNEESQNETSRTNCFAFEDAIFDFDVSTSARQGDHHSKIKSELAPVKDEHFALPRKFMRILDGVQATSLPQQSRGDRFNERLYLMFGGADAPHSPDGLIAHATAGSASIFAPVRKAAASKENSPVSFSDSGVSIDTSLSQSTKATSISGRNDVSRKRAYTESHLGDEPVRKKHKIEVAEDLISKWIAALQRLVKGKTKIGHKDMEDLSIVLAEIESVYPHLDSELAQVTCLRDVLQQISQLEEIPFKDEHDLRRRTDDIIAEWPSVKA